MIEHRLRQQLDKVAARLRRLWFWRGLTAAWLLATLAGGGLWAVAAVTGWQPSHPVGLVAAVAMAAAMVAMMLAASSNRDYHRVAERIEAAHPELRSCLLTAIEQRPELSLRRFGFLQESVIRQALRHAYGHAWEQIVPTRRIATAMAANAAALLILIFALAGVSSSTSARLNALASRTGDTGQASGELSVVVEPGDTEVEKGTSLLVLARYAGPQPADATLVYHPGGGETTRLPMSKSLDDPVFGGRIPTVDAPLDYHVQLDEFTTANYHVGVFEYPMLIRADARLVYPAYTALAERTIEDVRTVTAVEGTELTLICWLNKPVAWATLTQKDGEPIILAAAESNEPVYQTTLHCDRSRRLQLQLVDAEGRKNKSPAEFVINVLPNKPPDLKLAFPGHDIEVSPLEETDVKATAWDDFGLERFGLTYAIAGREPTDVVLGQRAAAKERQELAHVIRLEELGAQPDQLLSYHFWAEDRDAAGKTRRTLSDMYFAEVRHFDEIFRQGEQPAGGQQQQQGGSPNANAAEKLSQLQKDIINATWKLIRRETPGPPSPQFADDAQTAHESQATALEQASELAEKLEDPKSKAYAGAVTQAMEEAMKQLKAAHDGPAIEPLSPALSAEQAAYQALLKLRAQEHRVIRGQQGGGGGASGRSQQQLQQLELKNDENRYEAQRTAQSQPLEDRETRQALNRLSELARRQADLNERLKELQSAMQEARTPEEREEIRRQLKRLRDEEQEILRDTDELRARLDSPENQERMSEARQQLDQTRDQVRRAAEALDEEKVSQAAAAGTRAERDFQELRNEFRRRASGRFNEEMRQMRDQARELDQREQRIAEQLASGESDAPAKSLRDDRPDEKLPGELAEQQQRLEDLLQQMRQTIDEAESTEPLLSEQLYDTARKAQEQDLGRALEAAEISAERGLTDDAREQERLARAGIGQLREGIERAAESVLGDDAEALRRARDELTRLAEELNDEIGRNTAEGDESNAETRRPGDAESPRGGTGEQRSKGAGEQGGSGEEKAERHTDEVPTERGSSTPSQPAEQPGGQQPGGQRNPRGGRRSLSGITGPGGPGSIGEERRGFAPIAGEDYMDWTDRLRDVEEMVDDPQLRAEAARIRERAREFRVDLKRDFQAPRWDLVKVEVSDALVELRDRVIEELLRRTSKDAALPLDRDPVPPKYLEKTRRYYERLGAGQ